MKKFLALPLAALLLLALSLPGMAAAYSSPPAVSRQ